LFIIFFIPNLFNDIVQSEPPSAPQNLTVNFVDQSTVILSWSAPKYLGGRNDTVYRISCEGCSSSVTYVPSQENFNDTKVAVSGLNPVTTYRFLVFAENGVSGYDSSQFIDITVTTEASGIIYF
jgi:ephrin-B